jgi:hypothetical protein
MALEIWAHSPHLYPTACVRAGVNRFVFESGTTKRLDFQAQTFCLRVVPQGVDFKALVVYGSSAVEFDRFHPWDDPIGVYPIWDYRRHPISVLETWMVKNRAREFRRARLQVGAPDWITPRDDQPHRILVKGIPSLTSSLGRRSMLVLEELQADYPQCTLHLHQRLPYSWLFGANFNSGTLWFRYDAKLNHLHLPNGVSITTSQAYEYARIVRTLGFKPTELHNADKSTILFFNIKAAQWASQNWERPANGPDFGNLRDPLTRISSP